LPGRQVVTVEDLELLALNCRMEVADRGYRLGELIDRVREAGGTPVVPWGFGKWSGGRGRVVRELLETRQDFLLADNGNRLRGTAEPLLLGEGRRRGMSILAGSDPLPFKAQAGRVGSYGVQATVDLGRDGAAAAFRRMTNPPGQWTTYGELASLGEFLSSQIKMQLKKRLRIDL
jgi:hypothetical protein